MIGYVTRRIASLVPTWLGITVIAFFLTTLAPGDPARAYFVRLHHRQPSQAELAQVRHRFGLDKPVHERYASWVWSALHGDLGTSFATGDEVSKELLVRFPATLQLAGAATALAILIAIPIGVLAAVRRNSVLDQISRGAALLAASIPAFWLAFLLIIVFAVKLGWFPATGYGGLQHLVLPAVALALGEAAVIARLTRSSLLEVLGEDYVTTARAKGIPEWRVVARHGLRNAFGAIVTQIGLVFAVLLAHSAVVEVVFVWPGIGRLAVESIGRRDYTMIQGFVVLAGSVFVLVSLAVDLIYLWLDPRVTLGPHARAALA